MFGTYCAVRAGPLNTADNILILNVFKVTQIGENDQRNYNVKVFLIVYVIYVCVIGDYYSCQFKENV
jgi:hypothetical protein